MFQSNELAFYTPLNEEDEDQAKLESDLVNSLFFNECDGNNVLQSCLRDALLNRNATAKVFWDERAEISYEQYENANEMQMFELLNPQDPNVEIEVVEKEMVQELEMVVEPDGVTTINPPAFYNVKLKKTTHVERPIVESLPPEQVIISGEHNKPSLFNVRFVAHENVVTQSYLVAQGYPEEVVEQLEEYNTNSEEQSRARAAAEFDYYSNDENVRHIRVYECYTLLDVDGDGISELRKIVFSGGTLLSNDPIDSVAIVGGVTTAVSHKYKGLSIFDKLKDIQDAKTPVMRSIIEGTQLSSNPRIGAVKNDANLDDLLKSRTGGVVRSKTAQGVYAIPAGEVPQSSYMFLDMMNTQRSERGGSAISSTTQAQKVAGDTAHAFERTMSAMELQNALLARTFSETIIKDIFIQFHNVIRENYKGTMFAKVGGKWLESDPSEWQKRAGVVVNVGASNNERAKQISTLKEIVNFHVGLEEKGSVMFDESKAFKAMTRIISLGGIRNPESYFVDPESPEAQQKNQQRSQQEQEMQAKRDEMEAAMAKAQSDMGKAELMKGQSALQSQQIKFENDKLVNELDQLKALVAAKQKSDELEFKYEELRVHEGLKLAELDFKANEVVEIHKVEHPVGDHNVGNKKFKGIPTPGQQDASVTQNESTTTTTTNPEPKDE